MVLTQYLCKTMAIDKVGQNRDCELQLCLQAPKEIPRNCRTKDIAANYSLDKNIATRKTDFCDRKTRDSRH